MNNQNHCCNCQYSMNKINYLENQLKQEHHRIKTVDALLVKMKSIIIEMDDIKTYFIQNEIETTSLMPSPLTLTTVFLTTVFLTTGFTTGSLTTELTISLFFC